MAARSIASLTLSFGLVAIPVRLYSATESGESIGFKLLAKDGSRLNQQYVSQKDQAVVPRSEMVKGYEFEKDKFVIFTPDELKALEESSRTTIDIVSFIPEKSVDPLFYDKAYLLAPDKRGGKPYELLREALETTGRCALATWAWKAKSYVVQVRATADGLVLQQLRYAKEVRSLADLDIERVAVTQPELQLALQIIEQSAEDTYDASRFEDEEKKRVLAEIDKKIAGQAIVSSARDEAPATTGNIIDLMEALKASLGKRPAAKTAKASEEVATAVAEPVAAKPTRPARKAVAANVATLADEKERKTARRAVKADEPVVEAPLIAARARSRK